MEAGVGAATEGLAKAAGLAGVLLPSIDDLRGVALDEVAAGAAPKRPVVLVALVVVTGFGSSFLGVPNPNAGALVVVAGLAVNPCEDGLAGDWVNEAGAGMLVGFGASVVEGVPVKGLLAKGAALALLLVVGVAVKGLAGDAGAPKPLLTLVLVVGAAAAEGVPQFPNPLPPVNPPVVPVVVVLGAEIPENNPALPAAGAVFT